MRCSAQPSSARVVCGFDGQGSSVKLSLITGGAGAADAAAGATTATSTAARTSLRIGAMLRVHGDEHTLDPVVGVTADVPVRLVRLGVSGGVVGAAGENVLAGRRVPAGAPAAPGPAA